MTGSLSYTSLPTDVSGALFTETPLDSTHNAAAARVYLTHSVRIPPHHRKEVEIHIGSSANSMPDPYLVECNSYDTDVEAEPTLLCLPSNGRSGLVWFWLTPRVSHKL